MTNEEILKAAQSEKRSNGEYESKIQSRADLLANLVALILVGIMFFVEYLLFRKVDYGKATSIFVISFVSDLYAGIKLNNKRKIVVGLIMMVPFLISLTLYIGALF